MGSLLHMDALRARAEGDEAWAARSSANALALLSAARPMLDAERAALADQIIEEIRGPRRYRSGELGASGATRRSRVVPAFQARAR